MRPSLVTDWVKHKGKEISGRKGIFALKGLSPEIKISIAEVNLLHIWEDNIVYGRKKTKASPSRLCRGRVTVARYELGLAGNLGYPALYTIFSKERKWDNFKQVEETREK